VSAEELAANPRMRDLQQKSPELYGRVLSEVNTGAAANAHTADELAATSPALGDLQRTSPEALLDLFMLLKGAAGKDGGPPR
jgi:hypothetical protein